MRKVLALAIVLAAWMTSGAQQYRMEFRLEGLTDSVLYIARHYRDQLLPVDTARVGKNGSVVFKGKRAWKRNVYALVHQDGEKSIGDFVVDDSRQFTITADAKLTPESVKVKGSEANRRMFSYMARWSEAKKQRAELEKRKKDAATREQAEKEEQALMDEMDAYDKEMRHPKKAQLFFDLVNFFDDTDVPEEVEDKPYYFRTHYWDRLFGAKQLPLPLEELRYTPNLYNKLNYFFFGQMYHADKDTIVKEIDRLAARIGDDTAMLRYVFDHIEPRYFRSTRNIGWDAVWCHLMSNYYLKGRCPWVREGTLYTMKLNYNRIRQSLIGAHGQELWMADTNQSTNADDWISSHRFPTKYVILWFWDPDCHHCQEQSAELKVLYDSLLTAPYRPFEVYAVGYESDVEKWKKYVREHDFRWVNVGGPNVNIDYQEAYNVHGAPTMIILNERRDIIMNKVIPIKSLLRFLEEYEKKVKGER